MRNNRSRACLSAMSRPAADQLPPWGRLARLAANASTLHLRQLPQDAEMLETLRVRVDSLLFDFSRQRVTRNILDELLNLALARRWQERAHGLMAGDPVNSTERRPALHTALRAAPGEQPDIAKDVPRTLARLRQFTRAVNTGVWAGCSGKAISDVVNIGIGGSDLGPRLVVEALQPSSNRLNVHFVANIDGHAITRTLADLNPETTLFILASKSFTTQETRVNGETARNWFIERTNRPDALQRHFVAVTAKTEAAAAFGLPSENVFPLWDWVGGRYSLWSAVGLPILLALGAGGFDELLSGARAMDRHFRNAPAAANAPLLAALLGIWNLNFLGATSHAVLPYDERLRLLPGYLQQLETESNGKRVRHDGSEVGVHTMAVLWGGTGTTGQHAYHQLLHQGTRSFTADLIVAATADHGLDHHHIALLANAIAQGKAMALGNDTQDPHRAVPGNHATTSIVLDSLRPASIGSLLAFYEHKVFCQGLIWDINSFDQWGVELGKQLARTIDGQLAGKSAADQDPATRALIEYLVDHGQAEGSRSQD